jgi:hypothetical protein
VTRVGVGGRRQRNASPSGNRGHRIRTSREIPLLLRSVFPPLIRFFSGLSGTRVSVSSSPRFGFRTESHSCAQQQLPTSSRHVCEIHLIAVDFAARPWLPPSPSLLPTFRCSRLGAATATRPSGLVPLFQGRG